MYRSRVRRPVRIPSVSTSKTQTKDYEYVKGMDTNSSNDAVQPDQWRYVGDAREEEVGKWETRKGNDFFSVAIGEAVNVQQTSTTGASTQVFSSSTYFAARVVATSTGRLTALEANILNDTTATGTIVLALFSDNSGSPGTELFRTTIAGSAASGSAAYLKGRSITCPDITNTTTYWVVGFVQDGGTGSFKVTTTTTATTGKVSTAAGASWSAANVEFNVKLSTATSGGVKGIKRVRRSNGTFYTFMAHGSTLYSIDSGTGVTTAVDTGLDPLATYCRMWFVNDVLYYVTGLQKPRKYDFATASEVTAAPEIAKNLMEHKGLMFYMSAADESKDFYTNFGMYETFTSTDFFYNPAPKTSDPLTAYARLNGVLYKYTRNNKYSLYGAENATFRLDNAIGQKGTFTQESVAWDENHIYAATDDGIYRFNGAEEVNIAKDVLSWWTDLTSKSTAVLELYNNRLYVFYSAVGQGANSRCRVYNTLYGIWESDDSLAHVSKTASRIGDTNYFLQGSNRVGMVMLAEQSSNDYNTMGEPFDWKLRTRYEHYDAPAQFKRAPVFRPHFDAASGIYSVQVGYDTDYNESPTFVDLALQSSGPRFNTGETWDSGITYGGVQQINPMDSGPVINGQWRRLQIRYEHYAARQPVSFDGHVMAIETQRLI